MKLPDIPGRTSAQIAMQPETNRQKRLTSDGSREGVANKIIATTADMDSPYSKFLSILFGFSGFMNNEKNSKADKDDLKKTG